MLLLARVIAAMTALLFALPANAVEKVKIGFLGSLTGTFAILGAEQERGLEIAIEHLNGKIGNLPLELVKLDDESKPDVALQRVNQAINRDQVSVITGVGPSNVFVAIAK